NHLADTVVGDEQFVYTQPALKTGMIADIAARAVEQLDFVQVDIQSKPLHLQWFRNVRLLTGRADGAHKALREDGANTRGHKEGLDSDIDQSDERTCGVVGMQGAKYKVTGEGRLDGDLGG